MASIDILSRFRGPKAVDCCVSASEEILRVMALNFVIRPRPSRSEVGAIKVREGKREMEGWIYHIQNKKCNRFPPGAGAAPWADSRFPYAVNFPIPRRCVILLLFAVLVLILLLADVSIVGVIEVPKVSSSSCHQARHRIKRVQ